MCLHTNYILVTLNTIVNDIFLTDEYLLQISMRPHLSAGGITIAITVLTL